MIGCDFSVGRPSVEALKNGGFGFVGRYAADRPDIDITPSESQDYMTAGIAVILFYERAADWMLGAGHAGGAEAAAVADGVAVAAGFHGIPIYFAADFDARPDQQPQIDATLTGAASKIGHDRVGLYGGIGPVSRAFDNGTARYGCQTVAWSAGQWDPRVHVRQYLTFTLDGVQCDYDVAMKADFGQFPLVAQSGPFRHVADGTRSLENVARARGTSVGHLAAQTVEAQIPRIMLPVANHAARELEAFAHYLDEAPTGVPVMPSGLVFYTTNP